jgi:hypothetical protein
MTYFMKFYEIRFRQGNHVAIAVLPVTGQISVNSKPERKVDLIPMLGLDTATFWYTSAPLLIAGPIPKNE